MTIDELAALVDRVSELRDIAHGRPNTAYADAHSSLSTAAIDALPDLLAVALAAKALVTETAASYDRECEIYEEIRHALARLDAPT